MSFDRTRCFQRWHGQPSLLLLLMLDLDEPLLKIDPGHTGGEHSGDAQTDGKAEANERVIALILDL